jgi:GNAT superfamily N-acetyltransferase
MITAAMRADVLQIHTINANTTIFSQEEVETVDEMLEDYLAQGAEKSGYYFLVFKEGDRVQGYACYGPRALTDRTYDLYWIAVDPDSRGGGIGKKLLAASENKVRLLGGRLLIVETSGLPKYESTRAFYFATQYLQEATLKDFYSDGDDLVIFTKRL